MIYKVISNFEQLDLDFFIKKLTKYFRVMLLDNVLYVGLMKYENKSAAQRCLEQLTKPKKNFYLEEINEVNIKRQSEVIQQWCFDIFTELDKQKYEAEQQDKLFRIWKAMDEMEKSLIEKLHSEK